MKQSFSNITLLNSRWWFLLFVAAVFAISSSCQEKCDKDCQNNGTLSIDCECVCANGFAGDNCETSTCTIECQNNGTVTADCTCDCPSGFTGEFCETCVASCNLFNQSDYWVAEDGVRSANDNKISLPDDYVLTGLGFTTNATLKLVGRELLSDCTLGEESEFLDGSNPSGSLAVFYTVPDGHVVTGVGFGESQNEYRLVVNYNELLMTEDCNLYLGPEKLYDNQAGSGVEVWLKTSDTNLDTRYFLFGGLGIKYTGSTDRQVEAELREIINIL